MCVYPSIIQNRRYIPNKKNGGIVPPVWDNRVLAVPIGCGNCIECRKQKAREWQVRLLQEIKSNDNGIFVTLTFSQESLIELSKTERCKDLYGYDLDNMIATVATRRFLERWRKEFKESPRHWLVTELGHEGTEHVHMHGIIWTNKAADYIAKHWGYGYVWLGNEKNGKRVNYVSGKTASYITKYINKTDFKYKYYKPKILTSAGIGASYIKEYNFRLNIYRGEETKETYTTESGHQMSLPKYYRNKRYNDEEREKLWIQKLDKNERWVRGIKVDVSENMEEYYKILKEARRHNKMLGYGTKTNWTRKEYEEQRRMTKHREREISQLIKYEYKPKYEIEPNYKFYDETAEELLAWMDDNSATL